MSIGDDEMIQDLLTWCNKMQSAIKGLNDKTARDGIDNRIVECKELLTQLECNVGKGDLRQRVTDSIRDIQLAYATARYGPHSVEVQQLTARLNEEASTDKRANPQQSYPRAESLGPLEFFVDRVEITRKNI